MDDEIDGAVVLRDREEVGDTDEREHEIAAHAPDDLLVGQAEREHADEPGCDEAERAHVDGQHRAHDEERQQREDRDPFRGHLCLPF